MAALGGRNASSQRRVRRGTRGVCLASLLALVCWLAPGSASADFDGPQLSLVGGAPTAALVSTGSGTVTQATADVSLTVRNDADVGGRLRIALLLADGTDIVLSDPPATVRVGANEVQAALAAVKGSPTRIGARKVRRLRLQLTVTPAQPFAGTLIVSIVGTRAVSPLAIPLTVALAQPVTWTGAQLEPAAVTVNAPHCWPAIAHSDCPSPDRQPVVAEGIVATGTVAKGTELTRAVASSDSGGRATVAIKAAEPIAAGDTSAKLEIDVSHIKRYGTYETQVPLVPGADSSPKLTVKVIARDLWVWPLLVLLAGTALAYWLLGKRERKRPREVLQLAILETVGRYRVAKERRGNDVHAPYWLDDLFPRSEDKWECGSVNRATPEAQAISCRIAEATTQEQLDEHAAAVADLDARVRNWPRACAAATALRSACAALKNADRELSARMLAACHELITIDMPANAAESAQHITLVEQHCLAASRWLTVHALLVQAEELYGWLKPRVLEANDNARARELLADSNPQIYRDELSEADSLDTLQETGIAQLLREDLRVLRGLAHEYDMSPDELARRDEAEEAELHVPVRARVAAVAQAARTVAAPFASVRTDEAAQALRRIVRQDKMDAAGVFLITVFAYFVTIYPGNSFGSVWQYLVAFLAGAGGQVAVNWQLLPWYRSYRPKVSSGT